MEYNTIVCSVDGPIGTIMLNRPDKLNALNREMSAECGRALDELAAEAAVRVIVLKGAGRAFCAGADLSPSGATVSGPHSVPEDAFGIASSVESWLKVWHHPKPVIGQIHGFCIGGGAHIASFCDLVIAAEETVIGWPKLPVGGGFISPVWSWFVGPRRAKQLSFMVGNTMSGTDAVAMGWANMAVPKQDLDSTVREVALRIARVPSDVLRLKKEAINATADMQGFSSSIRLTGAWDAIAHASPSVEIIRGKIRELGLRGAISWFETEGL